MASLELLTAAERGEGIGIGRWQPWISGLDLATVESDRRAGTRSLHWSDPGGSTSGIQMQLIPIPPGYTFFTFSGWHRSNRVQILRKYIRQIGPDYDHLWDDPINIEWTPFVRSGRIEPGRTQITLYYYAYTGIAGDQYWLDELSLQLHTADLVLPSLIPPVIFSEHSVANVITGLGNTLAAVAGLRFYGYPVERIEPPACVVALPEPTSLTCGDGSFSYEFPLWVLVAKADARAANDELLPYVDPNGERSIRAAIAADRTLGGACDSVAILSVVPQVVTLAGTEFFAAEFTLEVVG